LDCWFESVPLLAASPRWDLGGELKITPSSQTKKLTAKDAKDAKNGKMKLESIMMISSSRPSHPSRLKTNHYFEQKETKETKILNTFETQPVFPRVNIYIFPNYFNIFVTFVSFCSKNKPLNST
jgi:hypothetical protein